VQALRTSRHASKAVVSKWRFAGSGMRVSLRGICCGVNVSCAPTYIRGCGVDQIMEIRISVSKKLWVYVYLLTSALEPSTLANRLCRTSSRYLIKIYAYPIFLLELSSNAVQIRLNIKTLCECKRCRTKRFLLYIYSMLYIYRRQPVFELHENERERLK
jgi:hypothetical protein